MEPGVELDFLIDEKIFGFKRDQWCPAYSTDMRASWTIIEHLISKGWHCEVAGNLKQGRWATFTKTIGYLSILHCSSTEITHSLAVCLAALKTLQQVAQHTDNCNSPPDCA